MWTIETWWVILLSALSLILLRIVLRGRVLLHIGAIFILAAVTFHAVSEVVTALDPEANLYRKAVTQGQIDDFLWVIGPAILVLTMTYLLTLGSSRSLLPHVDLTGAERVEQFFGWKVCLFVTLPLYLLALAGAGFVPGVGPKDIGSGDYFRAGVTSQFLLLGLVLTSFALIRRFGGFLIVVIAQSIALTLLGQRLEVAIGLILLLFLMARHGYRPTRRQAVSVSLVAVFAAVTLSSARVEVGRGNFGANEGSSLRVGAVMAGFRGLQKSETRSQLANDFIYRIDGNTFGARVLAAQADGTAHTGLETVENGILLAVPSFMNPSKRNSQVTARSSKAFMERHYAIARSFDFLPTFLGEMVSYYGALGLILLSAILGAALGLIDRWLERNTPIRTVFALAILSCVLYYERGFEVVPLTLRGATTLIVLVGIAQRVVEAASKSMHARGNPSSQTELEVSR